MTPQIKPTRNVNNDKIAHFQTSFEEKILAASPEAGVYQQLEQCYNCGRKFNPQALERHIKVRSVRL